MVQKILYQGAEAIIILKNNKVIKDRIKKSYRISELDDKLRRLRTRNEAKIIERVSSVIHVPRIIKVDESKKEIVMEFIEGKKLSEHLDNLTEKEQMKITEKIGETVAKIHDFNVIHGDLTTSNMILSNKKDKIYFIDFGLSFHSLKIEDKAVDLHLLKQAFEAKHYKNWEVLFDAFLKGYQISENSEGVVEQLKKVEARGRYKH